MSDLSERYRDRRLEGVILAAGRGTRIHPLSLHYPKALLPICNKPIIQYQLEDMKRIGVEQVWIVVGHLKEELPHQLDPIASQLGLTLRYVEQHHTYGIAHAVAQLESRIQAPFILFLGDIMIRAPRLDRMVEMFWNRRAGAVLAVKNEPDHEMIRRNFAVILHSSGLVTRVVEKPRFANTHLKGCGIYVFDLSIFDAIRRTPRTAQRDEYEITNSIQILIDDGYPVYPADVVEWDMNVTYACDIVDVNRQMLEALGHESMVSAEAVLHEGVTVGLGTVIGAGAVVEHPIHIDQCVIFPNTVVSHRDSLSNVIITPEECVECER